MSFRSHARQTTQNSNLQNIYKASLPQRRAGLFLIYMSCEQFRKKLYLCPVNGLHYDTTGITGRHKDNKTMGNIKILSGTFETKLELEHAAVVAGFPSPADDYKHDRLDFNRDYIRHPEASFYGDVDGDSMKDAGIFDGDRVIIDRAVEAHDGSIVVAFWNGEFTMKYLDLTHKKDGYIELRPANTNYPTFRVEAGDNFEVWGVVIHLIRTFEKI